MALPYAAFTGMFINLCQIKAKLFPQQPLKYSFWNLGFPSRGWIIKLQTKYDTWWLFYKRVFKLYWSEGPVEWGGGVARKKTLLLWEVFPNHFLHSKAYGSICLDLGLTVCALFCLVSPRPKRSEPWSGKQQKNWPHGKEINKRWPTLLNSILVEDVA